MGSPLGGGQKLTKSSSLPSDKGVTGYSILQAEDIESAQALLKAHPHLQMGEGFEIGVHESLQLPM